MGNEAQEVVTPRELAMSVLLQTLLATGVRSRDVFSAEGGDPTETDTNSAAGTHDADDGTKDAANKATSQYFSYAVGYNIEEATTTGTIDFVRVKFRARGGITNATPAQVQVGAWFGNDGHLLDSGYSYQCDAGNVELDPDPTVWVDFVQDFLTQNGSDPWSLFAVNNYLLWGFYFGIFTNDPSGPGVDVSGECSEVAVELWGTPFTGHTITASAILQGTSSGSLDQSGDIIVADGEDLSITATADPGSEVALVLVDGEETPLPGPSPFTYTFTNVTEDHTFDLVFNTDPATITGIAGAGGSIDPEGPTAAPIGSDLLITVTPDPGFAVLSLSVAPEGGFSFPQLGALTEYLFSPIYIDATITALFIASGPAVLISGSSYFKYDIYHWGWFNGDGH